MRVEKRNVHEVTVLSIQGNMDLEHHFLLTQTFRDLEPQEKRKIVFDLSRVSCLSSTGCCALVNFLREVKDRGGIMVLAALSKPCNDVLHILNLYRFFTILPSQETAIGAVAAA